MPATAPQSTISADELTTRLDSAIAETADTIRAFDAIGQLRARVDALRRKSAEAADDEAAESAARELVRANEDLRLGEILEPRKRTARGNALHKRQACALDIIREIKAHFERLNAEAYGLAQQILNALISPAAQGLRYDSDPRAVMRDQALTKMNAFTLGGFELFEAVTQCKWALEPDAAQSAESNARSLIEILDPLTASATKDIEKLHSILAAAGSSAAEAASAAGGSVSPGGATLPKGRKAEPATV